MPHDRKGRLVERGDIVRGKGYNIKHEIVGPVFEVHESDSCNVEVGLVSRIGPAAHAQTHGYVHSGEMYCVGKEYGAAKDFEIVMKHDGKVPDPVPVADVQPEPSFETAAAARAAGPSSY